MSQLKQVRLHAVAWALSIGLAMSTTSPSAFGQPPKSDEKPDTKQPAEKGTDAKPTVPNPKEAANRARLKAAQRARLKAQPVGPKRPTAKPGQEIPEPTVTLKPGEVPGIKFDMETYDFGRIQAGGDVIHDFWFTNTGNGALEILRVKPG
jgi:hypothetical protein